MMEDDFRKNYGIMIPTEAVSLEIKPDQNGVPIYAGCRSNGPCACTGACKKILGYDTDPDKVKAYHEDIEHRNKSLKERLNMFSGRLTDVSGDGKIRVWEWEPPKKD